MTRSAARVPASALARTGVIGLAVLMLAAALVSLTSLSSHAATGDETDYDDYFQLRTAYSFVVLAGSTITNDGETVLTGDVGIHPGSAVTGFPPGVIEGESHFTDAAAEQAKVDLDQAYTDAANLPSDGSLGVELGGTAPPPGVYTGGTFEVTAGAGPLVLEGTTTDVWVFQVGSTLVTGEGSQVELRGEADPCNVFWQVGSSATLGADSYFVGTIMAHSDISLGTGASVDGRLLARGVSNNGAVTLLTNTVTSPVCTTAAAEPTDEPTDNETNGGETDEPEPVTPPTRIDTGAGGASSGGPGMLMLFVGTALVVALIVRRTTQHRG